MLTRKDLLATTLMIVMGSFPVHARVELQSCRNSLSPEKQIQLGRKAEQQVYQQMPILPDSSPVTQYVHSLGRKLAAYAPGYKWPFNFHVAQVADINAFALPGGAIFVNLGTIQAATDEAQLAAVIAHEMSHVVLQHSICNAEKDQKIGIAAGIGQIAAGILLGNSVGGALAQQGIGLGSGLGMLKMSREAEQQADLEGIGILYDAGYDPRAMAQFFETIQQKYGKGSAQFLSDHPNPGNRTEYVDREVAGFVPKAHYVTNTPEFNRVHQTVAGMHAYTAKEVSSGVWRRESPDQTVSGGINQRGSSAAGGGWQTFQGNGFSFKVPADWQGTGNNDEAMVAPQGGIVSSGNSPILLEGLLTALFTGAQGMSLDEQFRALVDQLAQENPGMRPGRTQRIDLAGAPAASTEAENPSINNGAGERDWIVAYQSNRVLRYFVFVAPSRDFASARPAFEKILRSVRR